MSSYVSSFGKSLTEDAMQNAGTQQSLNEFQTGQNIFLIAGLIAIGFFLAAALRIIQKVWK